MEFNNEIQAILSESENSYTKEIEEMKEFEWQAGQMERLIANIMEMLEHYEYHPTYSAIFKYVSTWYKRKKPLLDMMCNHPKWNQEELAIIFEADYPRLIDGDAIYDTCRDFQKEFLRRQKQFEWCFTEDEIKKSINKYRHMFENIVLYHYKQIDGVSKEMAEQELEMWKRRLLKLAELSEDIDGTRYPKEIADLVHKFNYVIGAFQYYEEPEIDEDMAKNINNQFPNAKVRAGQKTNKVMNKICSLPEIAINRGWVKNGKDLYQSTFAIYSDAITPKIFTRKTAISVNPLAYFGMSLGYNWQSCQTIDKHNIDGRDSSKAYHGAYSYGVSSYALDVSSIVFFTVGKHDADKPLHRQDKINRCMFHLSDGKLVQGRVYPQTCDEGGASLYTVIRNLMQEAVANIYREQNLWVEEAYPRMHSEISSNGYHYEDYFEFDTCNISYLKAKGKSPIKISIGAIPICTCCGSTHEGEAEAIECEDCYDPKNCRGCGCVLDGNEARYSIHGYYYCSDCSYYCEGCLSRHSYDDEPVQYIDEDGNDYCYDSAIQAGLIYHCARCCDIIDNNSTRQVRIGNLAFCEGDCALRDGYQIVNGVWQVPYEESADSETEETDVEAIW